jgi:methylamine dehydrogenase heavy chain
MRIIILTMVLLQLAPWANAQVAPETVREETLPAPQDSWFLLKGWDAAYLFDSNSGDMQGSLTLSWFTPAVEPNIPRNEFYAAESFYSRGVRGERTDVLTIFDITSMSAKAEVVLPPKTTPLWLRNYIGLLGDDRHVIVFNMTPAQSVSVVDVIDREFVGEISTPGCALILPVDDRSFVMICGDGSVQLIRLDENGKEAQRSRSKQFFSVDEDPVFDQVTRTDSGWILASHEGLVIQLTVSGDDIELDKPWSMLSAEDIAESWRPGGRQMMDFHRGSRVLYLLMHKGGVDTHYEPGEEAWLFDIDRKRRIGRVKLKVPAEAIQVTQEAAPKMLTINTAAEVDVYDGQLLRHLRTIVEPSPTPMYLQTLGRHD